MWHTGLVAQRHVESCQTRDQTGVPCIARWILNHWTTREAPGTVLRVDGMMMNTTGIASVLLHRFRTTFCCIKCLQRLRYSLMYIIPTILLNLHDKLWDKYYQPFFLAV